MTFAQVIAVGVYFGTPLLVIWRWIVVGRRLGRVMVGSMLAALALWLIQLVTFAAAVIPCLGGHGCNPPPIPEALVLGVIAAAFLGILALLLLSLLWHKE